MKRPKPPKLPARIARWAQRDCALAAQIFRHPEVAERLGAVERFRDATDSLPSAQTVGYLRSAMYSCDALYKGDPVSFENGSRRRKTALEQTVRTPGFRAAILKTRKRFALGIEKICAILHKAGRKVSETSVGRVLQEPLASGKRQDQADKLREDLHIFRPAPDPAATEFTQAERTYRFRDATLVRKLLNSKGASNNIETGRANLKQFISDYYAARPHKALGFKTPNAWMKLAT